MIARDAPQEIDIHSAEAVARWASKAQTVTVGAGETASVQLDLVYTDGTETGNPQ